MKKVFLAMMAVAAIAFVGCKSNNPPTSPTPSEPEFFDMDEFLQRAFEDAKVQAEMKGVEEVELVDVTFMLDKPINSSKLEYLRMDTILVTFELGKQSTLYSTYKVTTNSTTYRHRVVTGVFVENSFGREDIVTPWHDAVRVIQENCPELNCRSVSINRSVYPEIKDSLVYNFSPIDLVDARTGEYIRCVPAPPM